METYQEIKKVKHKNIKRVSANHFKLNTFHDEIISETVRMSLKKVQSERGNPPAPFAFFLMGSAGRFEQSVWSDQDHGIIFASDKADEDYFLALGKEISNGLEIVGYALCDGQVMASNELWCKSINDWENQLTNWLVESSWESLRHFSTFFDSRVLIGEEYYLSRLKEKAFTVLQAEPRLYFRLVENVDFIKKGIGLFGQLLPELHGEQSGKVPLKQTAIFPYVNAVRLLALKGNIYAPSTLSRFKHLNSIYPAVTEYQEYFSQLLQFRLRFTENAKDYQDVHYIPTKLLSKQDKKELKMLMKNGYQLFSKTKSIIEEECKP